MKQSLLLALFTITAFCSCDFFNKKNGTDNGQTADTPNQTVTSCYLLLFKKDTNALQLTVNPDNTVTGFLAWEPFEKDGARGWIDAVKDGELVKGNFTYMIEGSTQSEEVVFKLLENAVAKGRGALDVKGDRLVIIDKSSLVFDDVYKKVDCSAIAGPVNNAKAVVEMIQNEQSSRYETLTGTYQYDLGNDQGAGTLEVKQLENDRVKFNLEIVSHAPSFNMGTGMGVLTLNENLEGDYVVTEFGGTCRIRFQFKGGKVFSRQIEGNFMDCGFGNNVSADQDFEKVNSEDPFAKEETKK